MILKYILKILFFMTIISCSSNSNKATNNIEKIEILTPETKFAEAMLMFDNQNFDEANIIFKNIERLYPLSNEGIQSQIMSGFIDYIRVDYDLAISASSDDDVSDLSEVEKQDLGVSDNDYEDNNLRIEDEEK